MKTLAVCPPTLTQEERNLEFLDNNSRADLQTCLTQNKELRSVELAWIPDKKETFYKLFSQFLKDLQRICQLLPNKSMSDVVNFYYNNKMFKDFKAIMNEAKQKHCYKRKIIEEGTTSRCKEVNITSGYNYNRSKQPEYFKSQEMYQDEWHDEYNDFQDDNKLEINREMKNLGVTASNVSIGGRSTRNRSSSNANRKHKDKRRELEPSGVWSESEKAHFVDLFTQHGRGSETIAQKMKTKTSLQCQKFYNLHKKRLDPELPLNQRKKKKQPEQPQH
jgi:hypothetical protein